METDHPANLRRTSVLAAIKRRHERERVSALLQLDGSYDLVCQTANNLETQRAVRGYQPQIVLLDLEMTGKRTGRIVRLWKKACPFLRILILSPSCRPESLQVLRSWRIHGVLLKAEAHLLLQALDCLRLGKSWFSLEVLRGVFSEQPEVVAPRTGRAPRGSHEGV